ncbi:unnamed protein product, partial [Hapterophycus canaliculatus]
VGRCRRKQQAAGGPRGDGCADSQRASFGLLVFLFPVIARAVYGVHSVHLGGSCCCGCSRPHEEVEADWLLSSVVLYRRWIISGGQSRQMKRARPKPREVWIFIPFRSSLQG